MNLPRNGIQRSSGDPSVDEDVEGAIASLEHRRSSASVKAAAAETLREAGPRVGVPLQERALFALLQQLGQANEAEDRLGRRCLHADSFKFFPPEIPA